MTTLSWGVLGASLFAIEHMMPALQQAAGVRVHGIASRELAKAEAVVERFGFAQALRRLRGPARRSRDRRGLQPAAQPSSRPLTVKAARAGKHVLCEKPIALDAAEAASLIPVRDETGLQIQEAYVVLHHPQWQRVRALVREGRIGRLRAIQGWFSYRLEDPDNIRNKREMGGGGLLDIGVYPLLTGRYVFGAEPVRVFAAIERHPTWDVDVLTSAVLAFPDGILNFTCSTLLAGHQHMVVHGDEGRIELPDPFAQSPSREARIAIYGSGEIWEPGRRGRRDAGEGQSVRAAGRSVLRGRAGEAPPAFPLEESIKMLRILDALARSGESGRWEEVGA